MSTLIFAALTSFVAAFLLLPLIIRYSQRKNFLAVPGERQIHTIQTPFLGGIAIFFGFMIATVLWAEAITGLDFFLLPAILTLPFAVGLLDDFIHLKPSVKLLAQAIAATMTFFFLDVRITSFYGLFTAASLPPAVSYVITLFTMIIITNSFNLIDGIDGLAGTFSLVALLFFGAWFYMAGDLQYALLSFALLGGIFAFLLKNWEPSKIFMGDTGSLVIGTMLAVLTIGFLNRNFQLDANHPAKFQSSIATAFCVLIIPLADTVRVIIIRLHKGISPLTPDKRHVHHALLRTGLNHAQAVSVLGGVHVVFITAAIVLRRLDNVPMLTLTVLSAAMLCLVLGYLLSLRPLDKP